MIIGGIKRMKFNLKKGLLSIFFFSMVFLIFLSLYLGGEELYCFGGCGSGSGYFLLLLLGGLSILFIKLFLTNLERDTKEVMD